MNYEILRLQNQKNQLKRKKTTKNNIYQYCFENDYSNLNSNKKVPYKERYILRNNEYSNNRSIVGSLDISSLHKEKSNKHFAKLPFKQGIFSYKNSSNFFSSRNNTSLLNQKNNKPNNNNSNYNPNNSLLSPNLKLNYANDEQSLNNTNILSYDNNQKLLSNNNYSSRILSSSSVDLNKYKKTSKNNINSSSNSQKNLILSYSNGILNKNNYNNNIYGNFSIKKIGSNKINGNNYLDPSNQNSIDMNRISPMINNVKCTNEVYSISLLNIDDSKESSPIIKNLSNQNKIYPINNSYMKYMNKNSKNIDNNNSSIAFTKSNKKPIIKDLFKDSKENEKESRRMIIEYIKILNKKQKNIDEIMDNNNFSRKVLNQVLIFKEFDSSKLFENSKVLDNKSCTSIISNSFFSSNNKENKAFHIKTINRFMTNMNDESKEKINMLKFLSTPRCMKLDFRNKNYKFIFYLCPSELSYSEGIESYIFKWNEIKTNKIIGGFDLVKICSCLLDNSKQNSFFIETFDGITRRNYKFETETNTKELANKYVHYLNYFSQLEKCKVYNNSSNNKNDII